MVFRNYKIEIEPRNGFTLPSHIPTIFGCTVSEPSALAGTSRGLVFTNENKIAINKHPVFTHRHTFIKEVLGSPTEQIEVDQLVWKMLIEAGIERSNVNVKVFYLDTNSF